MLPSIAKFVRPSRIPRKCSRNPKRGYCLLYPPAKYEKPEEVTIYVKVRRKPHFSIAFSFIEARSDHIICFSRVFLLVESLQMTSTLGSALIAC